MIVTSGAVRIRSATELEVAVAADRLVPQPGESSTGGALGRFGANLGDELVPAAVHRLDDTLGGAVVADRPPGRLHPRGEGRLRDEPIAPDLVEQLLLRHDAVPMLDEVTEELEHLGLDVDGSGRTDEREPLVVELVLVEPEAHRAIVPWGVESRAWTRLGCRVVVATGSSSPGSPRPGVLAAIGNTPAVQLTRLVEPDMAEVWVKLEAANPTGSYKDRMALAMIEGAERSGRLRPGQPVVEYTGGSTGSSLAFVCAVTGHPLHIVTSDAFADEKRRTMEAFGAHVEIVPSPSGITPDLIPRMRTRAKELADALDAYQTDQFANTDMVDGYRRLGDEVAEQVPGAIDALCLYVGTAGCFLGVSQALRRHHPALTRIAVEPAESAVLSGGSPGTHRIEGGGVGFRPDLLGTDDVDEVIPVSTADAFDMARHATRTEGLFSGPSTGANLVAALAVARRLGPGRSRRHHPGRLRPEVPRRDALPAGARLTAPSTLSDTVPLMATPPTRPST